MIKIVSNYVKTNYKSKTFVNGTKYVMTYYVLCNAEKTFYSNIKV